MHRLRMVLGACVFSAACWSGGIDDSALTIEDPQLSEISCGGSESGVRCWGYVPAALTGGPEWELLRSPVRVPRGGSPALVLVRQGGSHGCGLDRAGTAWCWGENSVGQLGTGTSDPVTGLARVEQPEPFRDIQAGYEFSCALGRETGTVYCWGAAVFLGLPVAGVPEQCRLSYLPPDDPTRVPCVTWPVPIDSNERFGSIAVGGSHACAVSRGGEVWCWGGNHSGQTGTGDSLTYVPQPLRVSGLTGVTSISASYEGTCASAQGGAVWCWGSGYYGALGGGVGQSSAFVPVEVPRPAGISWNQVSLAYMHACALDQSGAAWCWGRGLAVGNASLDGSAEPVPVLGGLRFSRVGVASGRSCGAAEDGLWCWGANPGDGSGQDQAIPVRVAGQGSAD